MKYYEVGETPVRTVTAKTRKRCPHCNRMIELGEAATLTDDRWTKDGISQNHGNAAYRATRGAWHLYHPACHAAFMACVAALAHTEAVA